MKPELQDKSPVSISVARDFDVVPERVFDAWLDPAKAGRFLFATPAGQMMRVEIDARVGEGFTIVEKRDGQEAEHIGTYITIDRPRRLVFTFGVPGYTAEITRVTIDLIQMGAGCKLVLTHEGIWQDYADRTRKGWEDMLEGLAKIL